MVKFGKFITKHKLFILILGVLLIIPSMIGMVKTRVNYDVLSYLPDSLETVSGQDIMVDEFGMGAFSMVIVENMDNKDVVALKEKLEKVDHVEKIIWYDSVADISLPTDMLPNELKEALFNGDATMMIALFDNTTSSEDTMQAVTDMRNMVKDQAFISGMSGIVTDIKNLVQAELPVYIVIAAYSCIDRIAYHDGINRDTGIVPFVYRISHPLQYGNQYLSGTDILYHTGVDRSTSAWSYDGLFHLPSGKLSGKQSTF